MLIVKTGTVRSALADADGDFEDWIARGLGRQVRVCTVFEGEELPAPETTGAIVVTGSAAMVTDLEAWAERTAVWLRSAVDAAVPISGRFSGWWAWRRNRWNSCAGVDGTATRMLSSAAFCRNRSNRALECSGPWPSKPWGRSSTRLDVWPHLSMPDVRN